MHPHEVKKTIGTGRMTYHCLSNSELWIGSEFNESEKLNSLLNNKEYSPVLLYPGPQSINLSLINKEQRQKVFKDHKTPLVIVLDATWIYAKKMLYRSPNLQTLPRISFDTPRLSRFLMRKQPREECFSTIEAVHHVIELFDFEEGSTKHNHLLEVFNTMVDQQLEYQKIRNSRHKMNYMKRKGLAQNP